MSKKEPGRKQRPEQTRVAAYVVDPEPRNHSYAFAEGVGECRAHFMRLVEDLDKGVADVVMVYDAKLFFIDTSPMWMEKLIATVKRRGVLIIDTVNKKEYDLRKPEDEAEFRAQRDR